MYFKCGAPFMKGLGFPARGMEGREGLTDAGPGQLKRPAEVLSFWQVKESHNAAPVWMMTCCRICMYRSCTPADP